VSYVRGQVFPRSSSSAKAVVLDSSRNARQVREACVDDRQVRRDDPNDGLGLGRRGRFAHVFELASDSVQRFHDFVPPRLAQHKFSVCHGSNPAVVRQFTSLPSAALSKLNYAYVSIILTSDGSVVTKATGPRGPLAAVK
jgi:hypothetical protein